MFNNPAVSDFKAQFFRDFPYGTDVNNTILDQDIANAAIKGRCFSKYIDAANIREVFHDFAHHTVGGHT